MISRLATDTVDLGGSGLPKEPGVEPIPGYRLVEPLGSGGFGEVWKCEAPGGLLKAIKFVPDNAGLEDTPTPADEELRALQKVRAIRHPFLMSLERIEYVGGELVIVQELADANLFEVLVKRQQAGRPGLDREELLVYLCEAAEALDLMNQVHNLQHLDIKPQNLFLVGEHVKVGDFGVVKRLVADRAAGHSSLHTDRITPIYSAPELFTGRITRKSDQYSLAIVYQQLLTGTVPFAGKNVRQLCWQHSTVKPDLNPLPPADRDAVARALSKNPDERFPSSLDFVHALAEGPAVTDTAYFVELGASGNSFAEVSPARPPSGIFRRPWRRGKKAAPPRNARLTFRFPTALPEEEVRHRLEDLREQWQLSLVRAEPPDFLYRMKVALPCWARKARQEPAIDLRITLSRPEAGGGTEVSVELRTALPPREAAGPAGAPAGEPVEQAMLNLVAPLLVKSIRSCFHSNRQARREDRLAWPHTLHVSPILADGTAGDPIECQGKDLSLQGIGFYLPGDLPSTRLLLHLPATPQTDEGTVPARVVRLQSRGEGWYEVGVVRVEPEA